VPIFMEQGIRTAWSVTRALLQQVRRMHVRNCVRFRN